jgi:hypothetical protein
MPVAGSNNKLPETDSSNNKLPETAAPDTVASLSKKNPKTQSQKSKKKPKNDEVHSSPEDDSESDSTYEGFGDDVDPTDPLALMKNDSFMKHTVNMDSQGSPAKPDPLSHSSTDGDSKSPKNQGDHGPKPYDKLLTAARQLDSGAGGELSGEPGERFVRFMAKMLPKGMHLDLGCATGVYLVLIKELRPDLEICGVEKQRIRLNMAKELHTQAGFNTQLSEADILELTHIAEQVTSMFMHDTVWTPDVVDASTKLVLENSSLEMVVCVQARPRLTTEGSFRVSATFDFTLRGNKTHRTALVYIRTRSTNHLQVRDRCVDVTRSNFTRDSESYLGNTETEKQADMEVRHPLVQHYVTTGPTHFNNRPTWIACWRKDGEAAGNWAVLCACTRA